MEDCTRRVSTQKGNGRSSLLNSHTVYYAIVLLKTRQIRLLFVLCHHAHRLGLLASETSSNEYRVNILQGVLRDEPDQSNQAV